MLKIQSNKKRLKKRKRSEINLVKLLSRKEFSKLNGINDKEFTVKKMQKERRKQLKKNRKLIILRNMMIEEENLKNQLKERKE